MKLFIFVNNKETFAPEVLVPAVALAMSSAVD
jgi:hypothetical protein